MSAQRRQRATARGIDRETSRELEKTWARAQSPGSVAVGSERAALKRCASSPGCEWAVVGDRRRVARESSGAGPLDFETA